MEGNEDTGSAVSEREVAAVTLNLARLHDLIDDRRAAAVQAARTFCHEEHIPSVAILSNESLQVGFSFCRHRADVQFVSSRQTGIAILSATVVLQYLLKIL